MRRSHGGGGGYEGDQGSKEAAARTRGPWRGLRGRLEEPRALVGRTGWRTRGAGSLLGRAAEGVVGVRGKPEEGLEVGRTGSAR